MNNSHRLKVLAGLTAFSAALCLSGSVWATATNSTLASAIISADTARVGGTGAYTTLTGPAIGESDTTGMPTGSVVLAAPPGWEFGTNANSVTVSITGNGVTPDALINTNGSTTGQAASKTLTPATNSITFFVTQLSSNTARSVFTWSGVTVRPINGTPMGTGTLTISGTSGGIASSVTQGTLTETNGAAIKLAFSQAPAVTNFAGSSLFPAVAVRVQDQFGNNVFSNNVSVTVSLDHGSFDFGGTTAVTGPNGQVVFSTLQIYTATNYLLSASASGFTNATPVPLTILPLAPFSLQFIQNAPSNAVMNTAFAPPVTVKVADFYGNGLNTQTVNMAMIGGGSLSGTTARVTDTSGIATFDDLSTSTAGSNKNLVASMSSPSLSATGTAFTVSAGPATKLGYTIAPASTSTAGVAMASIKVQIQDAAGNSVSSNGVPIDIALNTGAFASGTTNMTTAADGSVTFSDLIINVAGNYTLTASAATTSFTATPAAAFAIVAGPVSTFLLTQDAPSSVTAGVIFSPAVTVQLNDAFSNAISNKTVTLSLNAGGPLLGTISRATSGAGVAAFTNLSINAAGTNYALIASVAGPSMSITGSTFVVNVDVPTKLAFTTTPVTTNTAGVTLPTFVVNIQDQFNNSVSTSGVPIAITLNTGNFTSGTSNMNSAADGSATFSDLLLNTSGIYTLSATASGLTPAARSLTILTDAISVFQITQDAPAINTAGTIFSPPVTVHVADQFNNPITNKTVTLTLNGGGALLGTTSRLTSLTGVASFTNLNITAPGTNYSLTASITSPSMSVTGNTFVVTTAAPTKVVYSTLPATTNVAGTTMSTFVVRVQDQFSNNVLSNGVPIKIVLNTGSFASGTTNLDSEADGSATFSNLVINVAGGYTMSATSTGLTSAARLITVIPGPYAITFQQDAPSPATAGVIFSPAVTVKIADAVNNVLSNTTVTLTLNGGGALNGTTSRLTTNTGVATFTNLSINVAGTNYSLTATVTSPALSVTGSTFAVNAAAATRLRFSTAPVTTNTAGQTLPTFVVQVRDVFDNNISTSDVPITVSLSTGTFASGTTITNTLADGSATFSDLVITNAGNNTLTASATGFTSTNKAITVLPAAYAITFQQDAPSPATAGTVFAPPVTVRIADAFNNVLSNTTVALTLNGGGALLGTTSRATTNTGVATYTNLSVNVTGTNYSLTATVSSPALSVTGSTFAVNAAAATRLRFSTAPVTTNTAGQTLPTFVVQVRDAFDNNISTSDVPITVSLSTGTFASGTTITNTLADGSATFSDLVITNAGNNTLTASAIGFTSTNKAITVLSDVANTIAFVQGPAASITAGSVFTNTVKIVDQFNNPITNTTVTLTPNGFGTLLGSLVRTTAVTGVASFNNLSVNTPGTGYSITATGSSLSTTSSTFNVTVGAIHHYVVGASNLQARAVAFPVTVTAQDIASNTVPDNSTVVTMSSSSLNVTFDLNPQTLSNGTFVVNAQDNIPETISIFALDTNGKAGTNSGIVVNGAIGDYRSKTNGTWSAATTWQTWNGSAWVDASVAPAGGAGTNITVQTGHTVTNNAALSLTGTLLTQGSLTNLAAGTITVGSGGLVRNSGTILSTANNLAFSSGATYQHARDGGAIPTAAYNSNSLLQVTGITGNIATLPTSGLNGNVEWNCPNQAAGAQIFLSSATTIGGDFVIVSTGSGLIVGGGSSARNLSVGRNLIVQGGSYNGLGGNGSTGSGLNVTVSVGQDMTVNGGNFSLISAEDSGTISGTLNVGRNLAISNGTLSLVTGASSSSSSTYSMTVTGNTSVAGGTLNLTDSTGGTSGGVTANLRGNLAITGGTISRTGSRSTTVNFAGTSPQTYSKSAGTITGAVDFAILSGATVNFGTSLLDGSTGTFTLNSGGAIGIGDPAGITTSGAAGNIRVTGTRTYSIGGTYIYNGATAQSTSNGLPATVRSLIVSNTASTVTLTANVTVSNDLSVVAGALDIGSFTANRATSGGTNTVANGATMKIGGGNTLPSNYATRLFGATSTVEFSGTAQSIPAQTYGNLTTSGSGQKSLQAGATAIAGNLTIGSGTTFNAGTNNFSLAGNLTNDGSLYAYGIVTQTITFNGASPQSVGGASATAFNKVALNSGSVLNLTGNHSSLGLTIGGVPQAGGTWGATGSGASNIDDTHFQGTGTLAVNTESFTLVFLQDAPSSVAAGATFTPAVTVKLSNTLLDFVTNRTVTLSLNGGGALNGTLSQNTDTNGVASFTNLSVNVAGASYTLTATVPSLTLSSTGGTFSVVSATATKVVFSTTPPVTNAPGVTIPTFVVQLQDQFNNNVSTSNVPISITLNTGNFTSGTSNLTCDADGSATFFDLLQNTAGNYTMTASSPGLTSAARSLVVTNGPIAVFQFTQDAPASTTAGTIFSPSVTVHIADAFNNPYTNKTVGLTLLGGGTLNGTTSRVTSVTGVATYTNLNITVPGTNYALVANITSPTMSVTGSTFVVTTAAASKLIYSTLPAGTNVAGTTLPTFVVQMQDAFNNNVALGGVPITMILNTNSFASGTTNLTTDVDGSATFFDLIINASGAYTMSATSPGLTNANRSLTILPTTASSIAFVQQPPAVTNAGSTFTPSVTVKVTDTFNNPISNINVIATLNGAGTLNGTLTRATVGTGIATFNNLSVNQVGTGYTLTAATTNPVLSVNSTSFDITIGALHHYLVTANSNQTRGVAFPVTVQAQDTLNNNITNDNSTVVTMSSSSASVSFDVNPNTLSNGTFTVNATDTLPESISIYAQDTNGRAGTNSTIVVAAAAGDYRSKTNGNWTVVGTWQVWNGAAWVDASVVPAGGAGTNITIQTGHIVTNNAALSLAGSVINQGSLTAATAGTLTVGSGGIVRNAGTINSTANSLAFNSGALYQHTINGGNIATATWNSNSTCQVTGTTSSNPGNMAQTFGNLTWNCPNQTTTSTLNDLLTVNGNLTLASSGSGEFRLATGTSTAGNYVQSGGFIRVAGGSDRTLTISGNFTLTGGTFQIADNSGSVGLINVAGNFTHTGGVILNSGGANTTRFNFNGTGVSTYTSGGTCSNQINFLVNSPVTLMMGTNLVGVGSTGTFTNLAGSTLGIGDANGITTSGQIGNVRVTSTRAYNIGAIYLFNGTGNQFTSNGLPATARSLIVSNSGGIVSLTANVAISNDLRVLSGTLDLGSFTANRATSGGTNTVVSGTTMKIGGTGTLPSNYATRLFGTTSTIEFAGAAQNVTAATYGHLVTSGSSTKTLQAVATVIAGNLTIGSNTTFASTNNFSLAGNWANNGSGFSGSGSQTVTFNGASPQTISGTPMTFNNVAINSGSALNITYTGTATASALSIGGTNKLAGTWGATGSGATFVDDTHFTGTTGVLNVLTGPTSTTLLSSSLNPSTYAQSVTFTARVVAVGGTPPATGTITFMDGAGTLSSSAISGSPTGLATFTTSSLAPGIHPITAVYGGDSNFAGSTSAILSQQVNTASLLIIASNTNKTYGQTVTFAGTEFTTSGLLGTDVVTSVTLSSAGTVSGANAGSYDIVPSAAVGYDLSLYSITYSNGTLTVNQASASVGLSSSVNPSTLSAPVHFTAAVTSGAGTPSGTVQFKIDTIDFGSPVTLAGGSATSGDTTTLTAGNHTIAAVYSGDVNFSGATSTNFTQTVLSLTPFEQWQTDYFGCTNCPQADATADPDGDGQNNQAEFDSGTVPTNSVSYLHVTSLAQEGVNAVITWATAGGHTNAVQYTTGSGYNTNFVDLSGSIIITGSGDTSTNYTDAGAATNAVPRFYRIRLVP